MEKNTSFLIKDQFEITFDCNYDGYYDIYSQAQGFNYINYYNHKKRIFSKQYAMPGDNEIVLDASKKIYANFSGPYHQCNPYISQLLDYKNSEPKIHYLLSGETFITNGNCISESIRTLKLFKYYQLKDTLILIKTFKPKDPKKLEYEEFWKKNYKRLMGDS